MMLSELWDTYQTGLLALVIWREARSEGEQGMKAVGCSIRNRVDNPSWWGNDYGSVIGKKFQYSSMAAPGDPQLVRFPLADDASFAKALEIADALIYDEPVANPVSGADSFYDTSISAPSWATPQCYVGTIGRIRFYNVDRDYELPVVKPVPPTPVMAVRTVPPPGQEESLFGYWWRLMKGL